MAQSFTKNYRDHSNDTGFQFEFFCDKCGNGHRSEFKTNKLGMAAQLVKAAGAFLGDYRAGWGADHVKDAFRGGAWDDAFGEAIAECKPRFHQCTACGQWVCPEVCWNAARGLCEGCAPDLREQAARAQAEAAVVQVREQAMASDQVRGAVDVKRDVVASVAQCPKCQSALSPGARFCAGCGSAVAAQIAAPGPRFCSSCGGQLGPGVRFCSGCGATVA